MPKGYQHLTYDIRCQIYALKQSGMSQNQIAKQINISQSTISNELKRNAGLKGYRYQQAQKKAVLRRHEASSQKTKMTPTLIALIEPLIREKKMSPEQVSGRLKLINNIRISHESIYRHIWQDKKKGGDLYKSLRQKGKKRNKRGGIHAGRGLIPDRIGIECRPPEVATKERVGDWEGDTIVGLGHRGAIVSMVERKTKLVRLSLVSTLTANEITQATINMLDPIKKHVSTITTDNGREFAWHRIIASDLNAGFYFANPYSSWERGLNENTNGLVRQFFPKKTDFTKLTQTQIQEISGPTS